MSSALFWCYRALTTLTRPFLPLVAQVNPKLGRGVSGRRRSRATFTAWGSAGRDLSRPFCLIHAASAGELRQVEPVIRRLRQAHPAWQLGVTWSSPSAETVAAELPVDVRGFLPWDTHWETLALLDQLRPSAIVVSKLDLWPELALLASDRGIRLGLIAGTVRPGSGRTRWPARALLRAAYRGIDRAAAIDQAAAAALAGLGVRPDRITVLGDPRYDGVLERLNRSAAPAASPTLLVAGSTWAEDERVLLQAFARVWQTQPGARLLLVPHEPSAAGRMRIAAWSRKLGLPELALAGELVSDSPLQLHDQIGGLALRYGQGTIAYVGGGFGAAGLHSVLEPAAWGVPVLAGPGWRANGDAVQLHRAGGMVALDGDDPAAQLASQWLSWLEREDTRRTQGEAARRVVLGGAGAADRCAALVAELLAAARPAEMGSATGPPRPLRS